VIAEAISYGAMDIAKRFRSKYVEGAPDDCWEWRGKRAKNGYGVFTMGHRATGAHRFAWELVNGSIPDGLEIDHAKCQNRACLNPAHLEVVTHAENMRRARGWKHPNPKTHCKHGHEFTPENTRINANGSRACRTCHRLTVMRHRGGPVVHESRPCEVCGTVFQPTKHARAKYCSGACKVAAYRRRQKNP
jgi:hypothetical protein